MTDLCAPHCENGGACNASENICYCPNEFYGNVCQHGIYLCFFVRDCYSEHDRLLVVKIGSNSAKDTLLVGDRRVYCSWYPACLSENIDSTCLYLL